MKSVSPIYLPSAKNSRCCNTGYPVLADPQTGKTVCSCQLQTGVPAYLARVPRLPETLCNQSTMNISTESLLGGEHGSAFYTTHALEKHRSSLNMHTSAVHPYYLDQAMPSHPYGTLYPGYDFNGARRKSTSREATGPLKAWLYQHRKNPYPTKGEKVMLAIISQMTLTQVSTWFANARRRLKKEAKSDDKGLDLTDIDVNDTSLQNDSICSRFSDSDSESVIKVSTSDMSDISDNEEQSGPAKMCMQRLFSPDGRTDVCLERTSSIENLKSTALNGKDIEVVDNEIKNVDKNSESERTDGIESKTDNGLRKENIKSTEGPQNKPKIWSIAQIIG